MKVIRRVYKFRCDLCGQTFSNTDKKQLEEIKRHHLEVCRQREEDEPKEVCI